MAEEQAKIVITAENQTEAAFRSIMSGMTRVQAVAGTFQAVLGKIGLGIGLGELGKQMFDAAQQAQQAAARLTATLQATGSSAGITRNELDQMAEALAKSTQFDDQGLRNAEAQLLKFGNVQGQVFTQALKASADLAAFMGTDLPDAAQMVGRALSAPTQGMTLLERRTGYVSQAIKDQIKAFEDSGDVMSAQQLILQELNSRLGHGRGDEHRADARRR